MIALIAADSGSISVIAITIIHSTKITPVFSNVVFMFTFQFHISAVPLTRREEEIARHTDLVSTP